MKTAPQLTDLWNAAKTAMGAGAFDKVLGIIPNGTKIAEIEKLLTQCKLYVALYGDADANGKLVAEFIVKAEDAILARVDLSMPRPIWLRIKESYASSRVAACANPAPTSSPRTTIWPSNMRRGSSASS